MSARSETIRFIGLPDGSFLVPYFPLSVGITQELLGCAAEAGPIGIEADGNLVLFTVRNGAALYERVQAYASRTDGTEPAWEYRRIAVEMHEPWR